MKVVVVGSGGRLGTALVRGLAQSAQGRHEIIGFSRTELDLSTPSEIGGRLEGLGWDVLVNCAAITNVDYCESHAGEAMRVNAESPEILARLSSERGARMVNIGTDYVFDGKMPGLRREEDAALPLGIYGASKLEGDRRVLEVSGGHFAVRVSWVFGPDRDSFVEMILKRAAENEKVEAIGDKYSCPTYTEDFTGWLEALLAAEGAGGGEGAGGLIHLCNRGETTWQEYGQYALDCAKAEGVQFRADRIGSIRVADLKAFVAPRPIHTAMSTDRFESVTGIRPREWREAVRDYVRVTLAPRMKAVQTATGRE